MNWVRQNWLLLLLAMILLAWPLLTVDLQSQDGNGQSGSAGLGTDQQAVTAIRELAPDYQPWASPVVPPPDETGEGLLFALQVVVGLGLLGWGLRTGRKQTPDRRRDA